ncbi:unnamed protein product [Calypogeia fissa]
MDAPRSRRPSPQIPLGGGAGGSPIGNCPRRPSPTKTPLVPHTFFDNHNETVSVDVIMITNSVTDKKSGYGWSMQVKRILLLAIGGTLLFTVMLSLKAHFKHSVALAQSGLDVVSPSSKICGRMKNQTSDDRLQQLILRALSNSGSKSNYPERSMKGLLADFSPFEPPDKCASRGHRSTKHAPTPHLIQRLRDYEALHRKCAGYAENFNNHILQKEGSAEHSNGGECRFVVWIAYSGLGNRLLSLVSAFLYALLTNRILLVDRSTDMSELFCEPFPGTSWLVPKSFPHTWLGNLNETSEHRFGKQFSTSVSSPAYSYVHLTNTYNLDDRMFFCDQAQEHLYPIPWLFMRANNYVVPGLYFLSSFRPQLDDLFSDKEAIFHILGSYLFHPSNIVWGWIYRFRKGYLANNGKQVGIQIRTFNDTHQAYFQQQLTRCAFENNVVPNLTTMTDPEYQSRGLDMEGSGKVTSILVTSLQPEYYEQIRDMYMSSPTQDGQFVAVHQPSHEGWQKTGTFGHDLKAWADIYLLSYSDVLITSGWSTFGYSAQGLAGVKPWILYRSFDYTVPDPPCTYARSLEPCFHTPPLMDCKKTGVPRNPAKLLPFVQNCEEVPWGIKLIEPVADV